MAAIDGKEKWRAILRGVMDRDDRATGEALADMVEFAFREGATVGAEGFDQWWAEWLLVLSEVAGEEVERCLQMSDRLESIIEWEDS